MIIVIDPGHGGKDVGTSIDTVKEKDIVLGIALKLGKYISDNFQDVTVLYTRNTDSFIPLYKRATIANQNKADLFISLHANYCDYPYITGTETYVLGVHQSEENLEVAKKENAVILFEEDHSEHYENFDPNSSESYIMFELIQDEFMDQSLNFANMVQKQFKIEAQRKNRGVKQSGFLVLRKTSMPSVLIETGFISNQNEAEFLSSNKGQDYIASSIFKAFADYKKEIDAKSDFQLQAGIDTTIEKGTNTTAKIAPPQKENSHIYFSLQLAATRKNLKNSNKIFNGIEDIWHQKKGRLNKYYCGKAVNPELLKLQQKKIKKRFPDAFIVAFKNNQPIPIKEALQMMQ